MPVRTRIWTVARFPIGSWTTGGPPSSSDYQDCEVYLMYAESREQATKRAQSVRARLKRKGEPLPTQSCPYSDNVVH